jgi:nucleotide-binding universal stress UspA family protein
MLTNILFATDGSEGARTAGRLLASLPLPAEIRVTVLSVVPAHTWMETLARGAASQVDTPADDLLLREEAAALRIAEDALVPLRERRIRTAVRVRRQSPVEGILDQAAEDNAGLIVLGAHGIGAIERFLIGSVSESVARYASCSVLVARGEAIRRAIIAVDGSPSAEQALDVLAYLPLPTDLQLTAMHIVTPVEVAPALPPIPAFTAAALAKRHENERRTHGERILDQARERLAASERIATPEFRWGAAADELVLAARETRTDLIIVGSANRSPLGRLFLGSVSGRVLSHAPCSVLVARPDGSCPASTFAPSHGRGSEN